MSKTITGKDILRQLKADLIGKDSHRGVTFTYSWLANQFGHFSLGFVVTLIVHAILRKRISPHEAAHWAAWGVAGFWFVFELYNFLGPLLLKRISKAKRLFVPSRIKYVFAPDWKNIAFDTATDVGFFWVGAFSARLYAEPIHENSYILLGLLLALALPCRYWFITKMYLQAAGYPVQCRLSQWGFAISETDKQQVNEFLQSDKRGKHLLIFGEMGNGKTSLGIGIATERSIGHQTCFYTTSMKLYSLFSQRNSPSIMKTRTLWTWRKATLLVIDDINPGGLINDLITPPQFLKLLDANSNNRKNLVNKDVIWVLGNEEPRALAGQPWSDLLQQIGVTKEDIYTVRLPPKSVLPSGQDMIFVGKGDQVGQASNPKSPV